MMWTIPLFLLAMGIGYFVALKATEELGFLKQLGNVIAGVMIVGSLVGMAWIGYLGFMGCYGKGAKCPFTKTSSAQVQQQ